MANFLHVGQRIINMDLVTDVLRGDNAIQVFLAAPDQNGTRMVLFEGLAAQEVLDWFTRQDAPDKSNSAGGAVTS